MRSWFTNNSKHREARLPVKLDRVYNAVRVYGMLNSEMINREVRTEEDPASTSWIAAWNKTRGEMFEGETVEEKERYIELAERWSIEGPDDHLKPQYVYLWSTFAVSEALTPFTRRRMAEKRAIPWMRTVCDIFWKQCNMPILIYGIFKGSDDIYHGIS